MRTVLLIFTILVSHLASGQDVTNYASRDALFNHLYAAGYREIVEFPYSSFLNNSASQPFILETRQGGHQLDISTTDREEVPQFDYYTYQNENVLYDAYMKSYKLDNFMICYKRAQFNKVTREHFVRRKFQHCYVFPQPIDSVVERLRAYANRGGHDR